MIFIVHEKQNIIQLILSRILKKSSFFHFIIIRLRSYSFFEAPFCFFVVELFFVFFLPVDFDLVCGEKSSSSSSSSSLDLTRLLFLVVVVFFALKLSNAFEILYNNKIRSSTSMKRNIFQKKSHFRRSSGFNLAKLCIS